MSHTHPGSLFGGTLVCDLPTKKACDQRYAAWKLQRKMDYETLMAERKIVQSQAGQRAYEAFVKKEAQRVADLLSAHARTD